MGDRRGQIAVVAASPHQAAQVVALAGKQAQVQLAFGGQARAAAITAKSLGDAADDADFPQLRVVAPVCARIAPALGGLARLRRVQRDQRHGGVDALHHRAGGQHVVHAPAVGGAHIHEFNETQDDAAALEMPGHGQDFMVVGSPLDHHIHLDWTQSCGLRSGDAFEHIRDRKVHIVHAFEDRVIQAVQADGDALQARSLQSHRFARQ